MSFWKHRLSEACSLSWHSRSSQPATSHTALVATCVPMSGDSVTCLILLSFKKFLWSFCVIIWQILPELSHEGDIHSLSLPGSVSSWDDQVKPKRRLRYSSLARKVGGSQGIPSFMRHCHLKLGDWLLSNSILLLTNSRVVGLRSAVLLRPSVILSLTHAGLLSGFPVFHAPFCFRPLWTRLSFSQLYMKLGQRPSASPEDMPPSITRSGK